MVAVDGSGGLLGSDRFCDRCRVRAVHKLDDGGQFRAHAAHDVGDGSMSLRAQREALALRLDQRFPQPVQVPHHVGPLRLDSRLPHAPLQLPLQHQRQERAEHVAPDGLVTAMVNRPRLQQ